MRILIVVLGVLILAVVVYNIPFVNAKLSYRLADLGSQIVTFFNPPVQGTFKPSVLQTAAATGSLPAPQVHIHTKTPEPSNTPAGPTSTPTITPTPLPASITLPGVTYLDQTGGYNLCGPTNLDMALKFWHWPGQREDIIREIKPGINEVLDPDPNLNFVLRGKPDKNVMPYEMMDFVQNDTQLHGIYRYGGEMNELKSLIASGYPVLIEKGVYETDLTGVLSWFGHYAFVTGYDDSHGDFIYQDTYPPPGVSGRNRRISYADFKTSWRAYDYIFMLVYPADREQDMHNILGPWADSAWANQHALDLAKQDATSLGGIDLFFSLFNQGTSHVQLLQYQDAASAYDQAFALYATFKPHPNSNTDRPWRMMWYQTGPYWAYYYTGRYQDVINLANVTLGSVVGGPTLEESIYWRGMAELALGSTNAAVADFQLADHLNPKMAAVIQQLQTMGLTPETPLK